MPAEEMKSTVLVVEDNAINMKLATETLHLGGFTVLRAANGTECLSAMEKEKPHLVLLDLSLPDIDGFEVFSRVRQRAHWADIKIIALTALALPEDKEKVMQAGFDAYVTKPFVPRELIKTIREMLQRDR